MEQGEFWNNNGWGSCRIWRVPNHSHDFTNWRMKTFLAGLLFLGSPFLKNDFPQAKSWCLIVPDLGMVSSNAETWRAGIKHHQYHSLNSGRNKTMAENSVSCIWCSWPTAFSKGFLVWSHLLACMLMYVDVSPSDSRFGESVYFFCVDQNALFNILLSELVWRQLMIDVYVLCSY